MSKIKKIRIILMLSTLFISFSIFEVAIRFLKPQRTYSALLYYTGEQYREGEFIPFTLKKNYEATSPSMEFPGKRVNIRTNSLGLRGKDIALNKPEGFKRILVLGDSYTFGVYCDNNEVYPAELEELYNKDGFSGLEVINAGYADGWAPDEHYAWLVNKGVKFNPDIIIYGFFIGNDITGIHPTRWMELDNRELPIRINNPDVYADKFGRLRSRVKDSKTVGTEFVYRIPLFRESHMCILFNRVINKIIRNNSVRKESIVNNGWGDNPFELILNPKLSEDNRGKDVLFLKLIDGINEVAENSDAKFLILMIPINFQVEPNEFFHKVLGSNDFEIKRDYFKELEPLLEHRNIEYINLLSLMKSNPNQKYYPRNGEVHFNPNGHKFTSNALKNKLDELGWLKESILSTGKP